MEIFSKEIHGEISMEIDVLILHGEFSMEFHGGFSHGTSDAIGFLAEKSEKERKLKKEELAIRKRELDLAETRQEETTQQQQTMFSGLINTMQQQQNLQIMLDQQSKVFMALMEI